MKGKSVSWGGDLREQNKGQVDVNLQIVGTLAEDECVRRLLPKARTRDSEECRVPLRFRADLRV